jgi:hypothetical protein
MGYRSQVHALIYGPEDKICALVAKHVLEGGNVFEHFKDDIRRFKTKRSVYTATEAHDGRAYAWIEHEIEVIELRGDSWKWYDDYPDVQAWEALMLEAATEFDCITEFVRIGEDSNDIQVEMNVEDGGDAYLYVSSSITSDLPEPETTTPADSDFVNGDNNG